MGAQACGCSGTQGSGSASPVGQFIANAEACAKAEAQAVASHVSVLDVANAITAIFALAQAQDASQIEATIGGLIATYGEPIVACAVVKSETPTPAGSGAALAGIGDSARRELAKKRGWQP